MVANLLGLPRPAIDKICNFFNDKTLLEMRHVCKATKSVVDCLVTTLTNAKCEIRLTEIQEINVNFGFLDRRHELLWKLWFLSALAILKLKERKFFIMWTTNKKINCSMTVKETVTFLRHLHNFVQRNIKYTFPYWLTLHYLEISTINALPTFINEYYIDHITVDIKELEKPKSDQWLEIIKRIGIKTVSLTETPITEESHSFLVKLADIVDKIGIGWSSRNPTTLLPLSIVKQILCRRCSCFNTLTGTYSLEEAENMIKFLQRLGRRTYFGASIDGGPMDIIIGEYNLKIADPNTFQTGYIKHLDFPPKRY